MSRPENKAALVTGGSRGIGRGIAPRLARDGAVVAVNHSANEAAAKETVALIEEAGGRAFTVQASPRASRVRCPGQDMMWLSGQFRIR